MHFNASDVFYDLGCGDGRTLFKAIQRGCPRAVGVEIDPTLVVDLRLKVEAAGLTERISVIEASMLDIDFSEITVLFLYLLPKAQLKLEDRLAAAFTTGRLRLILCNTFEVKALRVPKEFDASTLFHYYLRP